MPLLVQVWLIVALMTNYLGECNMLKNQGLYGVWKRVFGGLLHEGAYTRDGTRKTA